MSAENIDRNIQKIFQESFIPFPDRDDLAALKSATDHKNAVKALNRIFNTIAGQYAPDISKGLLRDYQDMDKIACYDRLIEEKGYIGQITAMWVNQEIKVDIMQDGRLKDCALYKRINLIHELGVHKGQYQDFFARHDPPHIDRYFDDLGDFSELTAALIEKNIYSAISAQFFKQDMDHEKGRELVQRFGILSHIFNRQSLAMPDYLEIRADDYDISTDKLDIFINRPDVKKFIARTAAL